MKEVIDISRRLSQDTPVWPGDTPFSSERTTTIGQESNVNTHRFTMSPHVGTHVDAPFHVDSEGALMNSYSLDRFYGPCIVIEVRDEEQVLPDHLPEDLPARVLFKTNASYRGEAAEWHSGFTYLHPDVPDQLAAQGVKVIGTDAASVDAAASTDLPAHHSCFRNEIAIMENLYLNEVIPGTYTLSAFPLKCDNLEAAPVRAVLLR